ncbi:unnamed protein product [Calicophoron daubneyi]|uniref:SH3 domain-containing protein n=1 Tax=Calicophoron daubneyi TaxID=300641 RepID=A0AAV2T463_CALDB
MSVFTSVPSSGSAPMIANRTTEERMHHWYIDPHSLFLPWRNKRKALVPEERSSSENREGKNSNKPTKPARPSGLVKAVSAENRHGLSPWTPNNSPCAPKAPPTSSEISLGSSAGNGTDQCLPDSNSIHGFEPQALAICDFDTKIDGDLQFKAGDTLLLYEAVDAAWYRGRSLQTGQEGIFPMNHVEVRVPLPGIFLHNTHSKAFHLNSSTPRSSQNSGRQPKVQLFKAVPPVIAMQSKSCSPRKPTLTRVASLSAKYDMLRAPCTNPLTKNTSVTDLTRIPNGNIYAPPISSPGSAVPPDRSLLPPKPHLSLIDRAKFSSNQMIHSTTPPCQTATKPGSNSSVAQLVKALEQQYQQQQQNDSSLSTKAPEKRLVPGPLKKMFSSAPSTPPRTASILSDAPPFGLNKAAQPHGVQLVETPLVAIARQRRRCMTQVHSDLQTAGEFYNHTNTVDFRSNAEMSKREGDNFKSSESTEDELDVTNTNVSFHISSDKDTTDAINDWFVAEYDFSAAEPGDLTVKSGDVVRCIQPLQSVIGPKAVDIPECWLRCRNWFGQEGIVPSTFLRRIVDSEELKTLLNSRPRAEVTYEFEAETADDLNLKTGDIVYLYEAVDSNWYRGESASTGNSGMFPAPFVKVICPL